ncbi:MAG: rRNA maturation RNase YbeY [Vallitaleaceae bacterium]|nr:rRNA maturation RNase YbeY [Vallitaleaceae bacterium]
MAIIIENLSSYELTPEHERLIGKTIEATCVQEKCPYPVEVSITLVHDDEIKKLNGDFREIDSVTDVLSFPLINFEQPSNFGGFSDSEIKEIINLDTGEWMLGDIVISMDQVKEQSVAYGHSFERELGFLIVHSMLHLFGYDHMNDEDEAAMFAIQELILGKVGLVR